MRIFLLIPAFLLFLSNIPFVHKMDREEMMDAVKKDGCCKKSDNIKGGCKPADEAPACGDEEEQSSMQLCDQPQVEPEHSCAQDEHQPCNPDERQCGRQTETTCVCVCCFQFAAPDQVGSKLQFECIDAEQSLAVYLQQNWKDPLLSLPWQPPDGV